LEKVKTTTGEYLADAGLLTFDATGGGGTLLGFQYVTSTQIPTTLTAGSNHDASYIIFSSDWQECWVGEEEALEIAASDVASYLQEDELSGDTIAVSAFQNRQTLFRATMTHDIGLRRPQLFSVMAAAARWSSTSPEAPTSAKRDGRRVSLGAAFNCPSSRSIRCKRSEISTVNLLGRMDRAIGLARLHFCSSAGRRRFRS
jgi:hypothetical protein